MGKIAFVFPGQGAQYPGMGKDLYASSNAAREVFDAAGKRIRHLCFEGTGERLRNTLHTQPCLFTMNLACAFALREANIIPDAVAGFSLGEIPALVFAKAFSLKQGIAFVGVRAKAMYEAAMDHPGEMYAIVRMDTDQVYEICKSIPQAFLANYNCPSQVVVAVAKEHAQALKEKITNAGGKAIKLAVSGAFHSPFMERASETIREYLEEVHLKQPEIPVYSNVTALPYGDVKELLHTQVKSPVYWQKTIENMIGDGIDIFIETGPGTVLSGLIKKINPNVTVLSVFDRASLYHTAEELNHVLFEY